MFPETIRLLIKVPGLGGLPSLEVLATEAAVTTETIQAIPLGFVANQNQILRLHCWRHRMLWLQGIEK